MNSTSLQRIYTSFKDHFERELEATRDKRTLQALRHAIRRCQQVIDREHVQAAARRGVSA